MVADIGIEAAFGIWLGKEYGPALEKIYKTTFKEEWSGRELICQACGRTYDVKKPLYVFIEDGNARIRDEESGARQEFRGRCEQDGCALSFYIIGEDPSGLGLKHTALREELMRLVTAPVEFHNFGAYRDRKDSKRVTARTTSFYQGICNMSEKSASIILHHLAKDMQQICEEKYQQTAAVKGLYTYRMNGKGKKANKDFIEKTHKFSLAKPLNEFLRDIFEDFESSGMLTLVERTVTDRAFNNTIGGRKPVERTVELWDISPRNLERAKNYYRRRFPLEAGT